MATLTRNLFRGDGEGSRRLSVVEGRWPDDMAGWVFVVGPDKREPGGHWFGEHGLLCRIDCEPDEQGRVLVQSRRIRTPVARLRNRAPRLFRRVGFLEVSPFGLSNLANTNVAAIDGRLFVGYDAGRPIEVDPATLAYLTPVGANREWLATAPGLVEPAVSVAAHPAPAHDERALYFVNYSPLPGGATTLARWGLTGPIERWPLDGLSPYDSIHDVKATRDHLVISDLPFVVDPATFRGGERTTPNQDVTRLWIVAKAALRATPPGAPVPVREVTIPLPTGHLSVDEDSPPGEVVVNLEHIPLADLQVMLRADRRDHRRGGFVEPDYEGLVALAVQPGAVGRYRIDAETGEVLDGHVISDDRFWGPVLATKDESTPAARARVRELWYAGIGFDPDLIPEEWWRLYADAGLRSIVPPHELPDTPRPGSLCRFDLEAGKVAEVHEYADGAFGSPPTFVPRRDAAGPGDGYVITLVHRDGEKELAVFDARHVDHGPLARATAPGFNPSLPLHSCWMPTRRGPRPSDYRVTLGRDLAGTWATMPRTAAGAVRSMRAAARATHG